MALNSQNLGDTPAQNTAAQKFYFAAWRWHFYAGIFVIPFLIILAVTGLMMMFITQFDGRDGEKIAVDVSGQALPVSQQALIALEDVPGAVVEWIGPKAENLATVFRIKTEEGQRLVAVDPYAGEVLPVCHLRLRLGRCDVGKTSSPAGQTSGRAADASGTAIVERGRPDRLVHRDGVPAGGPDLADRTGRRFAVDQQHPGDETRDKLTHKQPHPGNRCGPMRDPVLAELYKGPNTGSQRDCSHEDKRHEPGLDRHRRNAEQRTAIPATL
ncbi:PepSY domain-containing protein [Ruegeria atlantica]|uniref:Putative iron-regulated membrane protein n=1 Tax=Ruegeria atlantica TaxID=81569 RepID=A0A0P1EAJ7_9RHOB|nr:putative iron-regulated membrane protein [Ruegeria atlantica]